jgi:hypothetical protein
VTIDAALPPASADHLATTDTWAAGQNVLNLPFAKPAAWPHNPPVVGSSPTRPTEVGHPTSRMICLYAVARSAGRTLRGSVGPERGLVASDWRAPVQDQYMGCQSTSGGYRSGRGLGPN